MLSLIERIDAGRGDPAGRHRLFYGRGFDVFINSR